MTARSRKASEPAGGRVCPGSFRWVGRYAPWSLLLAASICVSSSSPCRGREAAGFFWDRYLSVRAAIDQPDSARQMLGGLLAEDRNGFLANWLLGSLPAGALDPADADSMLVARAMAVPDSAGAQVAAGIRMLSRGQTEQGRILLDRARDAYIRLNRPLDACRSVLWKAIDRRDSRDRASVEADIAEAESMARRFGDPETLADVLLAKAGFAYGQSFDAALQIRREALELLMPLGPGFQLMACHRGIGNALLKRGDLDDAERSFHSALELARRLGYRLEESYTLAGLAHVARARGKFRDAIRLQMESLQICEELDAKAALATRLADLGILYNQLGRYREAREHLERCIALNRALGIESEATVSILDALGALEASTGNPEKARSILEEALQMCEDRGYTAREPFVLLHLAQFYMDVDDLDQAGRYVEDGLRLADKVGDRRVRLLLLSLKVEILRREGHPAEALPVGRSTTMLAREIQPQLLPIVTHGVARTLHELGRTDEAIALLDSLRMTAHPPLDTLQLCRTLALHGELLVETARIREAIPVLEEALGIARFLRRDSFTSAIEIALGRALQADGRDAEAVALLERGLKRVEAAHSMLAVSAERIGLIARWYDGYVCLARGQVRCGRAEEAFETMERSRGRELREIFRERALGLDRMVPENLVQEVERVESDLSSLQLTLLRQYEMPLGERSEEIPDMERQVDSLKAAWSTVSARIERAAPDFARHHGLIPPMGSRSVQAALSPGERVAAFMVGSHTTLLVDLDGTSLRIREIPWGENELAERVQGFTALLATDATAWQARAAALGDTLLGAIDWAAKPPSTLYVLPDGPLHYLPFEALTVLDREGRRALVVAICDVVYGSSASLLFQGREKVARSVCSLVGFGDPARAQADPAGDGPAGMRGGAPRLLPLPYARRELEGLREIFPDARLYVGEEATEQAFYRSVHDAPILHVAAHGYFDDQHPRFSGLVLAAGPEGSGDDGLIQAYEVASRSIDVDLVTLSACETGQGTMRRGEGLIGLARAFRISGSRNLIVSLWKVDDAATADLMLDFYRRVARGDRYAAALRGAKLAAGRQELGSEDGVPEPSGSTGTRGVGRRPREAAASGPAAWSAFVLVGTQQK